VIGDGAVSAVVLVLLSVLLGVLAPVTATQRFCRTCRTWYPADREHVCGDPAEVALAAALPVAFPFADWGGGRMRRDAAWSLLCELTNLGWELVPTPTSLMSSSYGERD
jgi:hypothetical protein